MFNRKQKNLEPKIRTASRTDSGVHALTNAFTFDSVSEENEGRKLYTPDELKRGLNNHLAVKGEKILINQLYECQDNFFNCRSAPT